MKFIKTKPNDLLNQAPYFGGDDLLNFGITKRELFAALAMQGMLANPECGTINHALMRNIVKTADALIEALNKEN